MFPFWIEIPIVSLMQWLPFAVAVMAVWLTTNVSRGSYF